MWNLYQKSKTMSRQDSLKQVYAASNSGLDIILSVCPQAADAVGNKRNFKFRPDERTASAHLYPPDNRCDYWRIVDYGLGEGERWLSPIDLYMMDRGYSQSDFAVALHELMEAYGVAEELSSKVNRPEIERRPAAPGEVGQPPRVTFRDGFTAEELAVWGPCVKPIHLEQLGFKALTAVARTKDGVTTITKATLAYPIFAQTCLYINSNGTQGSFLKLYEPKNPNKAYRFSIVGVKPQHYLFGLNALRQQFEQRGEEKLDEVVLVSGGSDAVNSLSKGYQPVWMGSETEELGEEILQLLLKYARRVVNIPDIDATGVKVGIRLALRYPKLYTAWLTPKDMAYLHDNRGRQRKDLKDYLQLHSDKDSMKRLISRAKSAEFWQCLEDKNKPGHYEYSISRTRLDYFLTLNGYYTMKDDKNLKPQYVRIVDNVVTRVVAKSISVFLNNWCEQQGLDEQLRNKLLRSHDLPNNETSTLRERDDLDFTRATATTQRFYFRNGWVEVDKDGCVMHRYQELTDRYVWAENIIDHEYRPFPPMFTVECHEDGTYGINIASAQPSKFFQFVINASRLYWRKTDELGLPLTEAEIAEEQQCLISKLAAIGYLLHRYKSESQAWAVFCQDSTMGETEDECNGRSGKSFFLKAISQLLNMFFLDARVPSIVENRFIFDGVTEATDLIVADECAKQLNLDFFFGKISGDLRYEEKGNHPRLITFDKSPKICFATNYVQRKHDPSTDGRIWPQTFSDYYHESTKLNDYRETRTIRDDFGQNLMGTEYPEADWQADFAFMLQCLQFYLSLPVEQRRILPPMSRIEQREQRAAVGRDFEQWANEYFAPDSGNLDREIKCADVLANFNQETHFNYSPTKLTRHLKAYCDFSPHISCLNPASITGKQNDGEPWVKRENVSQVRYYYVQSATEDPTKKSLHEQPTESDLFTDTATPEDSPLFSETDTFESTFDSDGSDEDYQFDGTEGPNAPF